MIKFAIWQDDIRKLGMNQAPNYPSFCSENLHTKKRWQLTLDVSALSDWAPFLQLIQDVNITLINLYLLQQAIHFPKKWYGWIIFLKLRFAARRRQIEARKPASFLNLCRGYLQRPDVLKPKLRIIDQHPGSCFKGVTLDELNITGWKKEEEWSGWYYECR